MRYTNCRLCGSSTFPRKGKIRSTRSLLADKILECKACSFVFLNDDSHISQTHYEESLMHDYEKTLEDSREESKEEDLRRYDMLKSEILNKKIIEVGVGNGGFSFRSKKLLEVPLKRQIPFNCTTGDFYKHFNANNFAEDGNICVHNRHMFVEEGCKFPSVDVAARFSYETSVPENQGLTPFGFHFNLPPTISIEE